MFAVRGVGAGVRAGVRSGDGDVPGRMIIGVGVGIGVRVGAGVGVTSSSGVGSGDSVGRGVADGVGLGVGVRVFAFEFVLESLFDDELKFPFVLKSNRVLPPRFVLAFTSWFAKIFALAFALFELSERFTTRK